MGIEEKVQVPEAKSLRWVANMLGGVDQEKGFPRTAAFYCQTAADLIESLKAQLSKSQRRERAVVEVLDEIYERTRPGGKEGGYPYGGTTCIGADVYNIVEQWRGPQAGEGAENE